MADSDTNDTKGSLPRPVRVGHLPAVKAAAHSLRFWLSRDERVLPSDAFVPGVDIHEQFLDWSLRNGLAPFTQRVTLTALVRHIGAESVTASRGARKYRVPELGAVPLVSYQMPERWSDFRAAMLEPADYPWVRQLMAADVAGRELAREQRTEPSTRFAEGLAWSKGNRWMRPPQLGDPEWRMPMVAWGEIS